jgi:pyruvate dehydrogenase E2 component (dihydrolipoyllysine-residue acetyltransferase)
MRLQMEFRLPELGEGIESATVTAVLVKSGDAVAAGQNVLSVETDKAAVDVPVDAAGTVGQVHVKPGEKLPIGAPILTLTESGKAGAKPPAAPAGKVTRPAPPVPPAGGDGKRPEAAPANGANVEFKLPALGEGIDTGTITAVLVKPGDTVKSGQNVVTIETDKAAVDVPAEAGGVVQTVHVKPGDKVPVGGKLLTLTASRERERPEKVAPVAHAPGSPVAPRRPEVSVAPADVRANGNGLPARDLVPAGPATRRLARELGVGLAEVRGSGRGGRVTLDDVKGFVKSERQRLRESGGTAAGGTVAAPPLPDFAKYGPVEVRDVSQLRQTIARNLTAGWRTMPMVTQHDVADITELEAGRKRIIEGQPKDSPKITMTVLAIKACVAALKEFPHFNSSYDMAGGKLIVKKYFHIGIAVDTKDGLVVPVIRDADKKSIRDLAAAVGSLAEKAKARKLAVDEMRGGTFTISNLGGIGGTAFTPIVNYPEVAILGISRSTLQPVVRDGQVVPRLMMPLSLTYDHRVVDGADGCRFTTRLAQLFSDPLRLLMET